MLNTALIEEKNLRTEEADNSLLKRKSLYLPASIGLIRFISMSPKHSIAKKRKKRLEIIDIEPTISISNIKFKYDK